MNRLSGKVAILSGGARGMGAATARLFTREGAKVVIGDVLVDAGHAMADSINTELHDERCWFVPLDVRHPAAWESIVGFAEERGGGVDILVNNAAIVRLSDAETASLEEWSSVIDVNQTGTWLGMKAVIPSMRRRGGGSIVNISSIGGLVGTPGHVAYHAAKGAVRMLAKHAAVAFGEAGIRCNTVFPGPTETDMLATLVQGEDAAQGVRQATALKRLAQPVEIAQAVLFLASDEASYVTGADLAVDGGYTAA